MTQRERVYEYARIADVLRAEGEADAARMRGAFRGVALAAAALSDPPTPRTVRRWEPYDAARDDCEPFDVQADWEEWNR